MIETIFAPYGPSNTVTLTTSAQRFQLPPLPSGNPAIRLISLESTQQSYYLVTGDVSVTANTTNSMRVPSGSIGNPLMLGINPNASHISIFVDGTSGKAVLTPGSLSGDVFGGDNVTMNWKGVWSSTTAYVVDDLVSYNGASYIAVNAATNSVPPSANWNIVAARGSTGATGDTGATGLTGLTGSTGAAATIAVANTVTLPAGSPASVQNIGTSAAANLKFSIPLSSTEHVVTRTALNSLVSANTVIPGRTYLISDEAHVAYGITTSTVYDPPKLYTGNTAPSSPRTGDWWLDTN